MLTFGRHPKDFGMAGGDQRNRQRKMGQHQQNCSFSSSWYTMAAEMMGVCVLERIPDLVFLKYLCAEYEPIC